MYGYTITINGSMPAQQGDICYKNIVCSNYMIHKFEKDKIFSETDKYIVLLDGVILNKNELIKQFNTQDDEFQWRDTLIKMYASQGEQFFKSLYGSFSGAVYDKSMNKWIIFCDPIGSKFTFYAYVGESFFVAEDMGNIYKMMRKCGHDYQLSIDSAYLLLSFGFMIEDKTLCVQVKKVRPGCYIVFENNKVEERSFFKLDNTFDNTITENDAIEIVDYYFRKAIHNAFSKDLEYGYKHIVALSGGLDSRMTSYVAHEMGYIEQLNYTFSQSDYWDETIPKKIANDLKHEWVFKFLNNGLWLYNIDRITEQTGGNVLYYGSAHSDSLFRVLNFSEFGIIHTGQISGALNGSKVSKYDDLFDHFDFRKAMYSTKYYDKVKHLLTVQINQELGWYYYRCLNGTCYGTQRFYNYSESYSPFLDLEFLVHILQIPISFRVNRKLYKKWIISKYPKAAEYEWETTGQKIDAPVLHIRNKEIPWANIPRSIKAHARIILGLKESVNNLKSMNPVAYYISHNNDLREYLDDYFKYVDAIPNLELRSIIHDIQLNGTAMEKIQAVSLLSAIKLFFV